MQKLMTANHGTRTNRSQCMTSSQLCTKEKPPVIGHAANYNIYDLNKLVMPLSPENAKQGETMRCSCSNNTK